MVRKAFVMRVHATAHEEYRRRHDAIWPELVSALRDHGVISYSIFLDAARSVLFAYVELDSLERWNALATTEVCQRWWRFMRDVMDTHADRSPVSEDLPEMFHLSG